MPQILLIEDEDFIRDVYKEELELVGLPTDAFAGGDDGLRAVTRKIYDLILLDIILPDTNGLDVLKQIKQNPKTKDIPVVLLTNLDQDIIIKQGLKFGAAGYLIKASFTPGQVAQEVKNILKHQEAERLKS